MKWLCFLFLLISLGSFAQLDGSFCTGRGYSICMTFKKNGTFHYSYWHCTGHNSGKGHYTLQDSILVLNFETDSLSSVKEPLVDKQPTMQTDSVLIRVEVLDDPSMEVLYGAKVGFYDQQSRPIARKFTDFDGYAELKVPFGVKGSLTVEESGRKKTVELELTADYNCKVFLLSDFTHYLGSGDTKKFIVDKISRKYIDMHVDSPDAAIQHYVRIKRSDY